jgi:Zinc finger, C3HC4 type (RING finger)
MALHYAMISDNGILGNQYVEDDSLESMFQSQLNTKGHDIQNIQNVLQSMELNNNESNDSETNDQTVEDVMNILNGIQLNFQHDVLVYQEVKEDLERLLSAKSTVRTTFSSMETNFRLMQSLVDKHIDDVETKNTLHEMRVSCVKLLEEYMNKSLKCFDEKITRTQDDIQLSCQKLKKGIKLLQCKNLITPNICPICMNTQVHMFCSPCGHTFCDICINTAVSKCHVCRSPIKSVHKLYYV